MIGTLGHDRAGPARSARSRGFTIVELLVVMAVVSILLALALPAASKARAAASRTQCLNHLRNIALAMSQYESTYGRLPASGYYFPVGPTTTSHNHSWAVAILPWLEQRPLYNRWDFNKPITDPVNQALGRTHLAVYVCPRDVSRSKKKDKGDLSYVVNGGIGFTVGPAFGHEDCPVDTGRNMLDLNGDGAACTGGPADEEDYRRFKQMGLFFLENWKRDVPRHHALSDVRDGLSQTCMVTENVRAGYDPNDPESGFANPNPYRCAFYIGNPCPRGRCGSGDVDYSMSNAGESRINSGVMRAEGDSPVPNSFHDGGVNMAYADAHVKFLSEAVDGAVYAALASPQGVMLRGTALEQVVVSDGAY